MKHQILGLCATVAMACPVSAQTNDPGSLDYRELPMETLEKGFQNPPAEARPFVRWWWNDNRIIPSLIDSDLNKLKDAGIGGVEINPVGANGSQRKLKSKVPSLSWRSKKWDEMLHLACKGARKRGMIADVLPGSGWPFGGEFLTEDQQIMRVDTVDRKVTGPKKTRFKWAKLDEEMRHNINHGEKGETSLHFVKLYPVGISAIDQVIDITDQVKPGDTLTVDVPEGKYVVSFGIFQSGYRYVSAGTKGAKGSSMDHYQRDITRFYLNRLKGVEETWGEPLSTYVRAVFCDSIETAAANWTHGTLESFKSKMGYDIDPYLPFVVREDNELKENVSMEFNDIIRRARYDWSFYTTQTFHENFTKEFAKFCHENDLFSRFQAYGTPWLMAMAEGYMIPDIPESNNWIRVDPYEKDYFTSELGKGYMVWSKYAAAGGRLRNKRIVSIEAMTTTENNFERTLSTIKQADDMNFIAGITHTVLHGYNSSPDDLPFPGYIRYGTFFSSMNTWWPYFRHWADYNARLSYVMQNTAPTAEIAIIGPTPDIWSTDLMNRGMFHRTPRYIHLLWESISQLGGDCDYLHADVIENADTSQGRLRHGASDFEALFVTEMKTMRPETAEAIQRFAENGGKVAFIGALPFRSPGLLEVDSQQQRIAKAIAAALKAGAVELDPPTDEKKLRPWVTAAFESLDVDLVMKITEPRDGLFTLRKKSGDEDVIFITNTYQKESSRGRVQFDLGERGLWRWNAETGERTPYDLPYNAEGFQIDLRPVESVLLVTGKKEIPEKPRKVSSDDIASMTINTPWIVTFNPAQEDETFRVNMQTLSDFSTSDRDKVVRFSGTAEYRTEFSVEDESYTLLDLGWDNAMISEVFINGKSAGTNWYGSKLLDLSGHLKNGTNGLLIKYTTTLNNKMNEEPQATGLIGPVRLLKTN